MVVERFLWKREDNWEAERVKIVREATARLEGNVR